MVASSLNAPRIEDFVAAAPPERLGRRKHVRLVIRRIRRESRDELAPYLTEAELRQHVATLVHEFKENSFYDRHPHFR